MESQPQNPEFRNNPENFHPWRPGSSDKNQILVNWFISSFLFMAYLFQKNTKIP